ncbi:MAG TPA: hypothetical protein VFJ15_02255 [Oleiagrimonas sp.]|nr:hypothetical protein [Oleiagrimonas sp.]
MTDEFLLNDKQVAMDAVLAACHVAAERCAEGADIVDEDAGLAASLRHAAQKHGEAEDALRGIIRRTDHLPQGENDEKEWLTSLAVQLRALVSPERTTRVIEACLKSETDVLDAMQGMSAFSLEPPLEACLTDLRELVRQTMQTLQQARPASD